MLVVDDLHWADQTLLDLIEHLAAWSRDVPMLMACLARPELLDQRPGWAAGLEATTLVLGPLGPAESSALLDDLLGKARLEDRGRERT